MKALINIIAVFLLSAVQAQVDSTMFGLARGITTPTNVQSGYMHLAKVNTSSAVVSTISPSSLATSFALSNNTIDNRKNHYYFVNGSNQLVKVDLLTGATLAAVTLTNTNGSNLNLLNYHCADSTIYGLASGITTPTNPLTGFVYFARVNPTTGSVTNISASSIANMINMSKSTIDSKNNIFYFIGGSNQLIGISLATGSVISSVGITNSGATNFGEIVYNRLDSTIYGLAYGIVSPSNPQSGYVYLARINPVSGVVTNVSATSIATAIAVGSTEIDPYHNAFYFINGNRELVSLNLSSGSIVASNSLVLASGQYFDGLRYKHRVCTSPGGQISYLPRVASSTNAVSIREAEKSDGISIFPNPVQSQINITLNAELYHWLQITDITGRVILKKEIRQNAVSIDLSDLSSGVYSLRLLGDNNVVTKQIIVPSH